MDEARALSDELNKHYLQRTATSNGCLDRD